MSSKQCSECRSSQRRTIVSRNDLMTEQLENSPYPTHDYSQFMLNDSKVFGSTGTLVPGYHPRFAVKVGKIDYASVATAWTNIAGTFMLMSFECILPMS